MSSTGLRTNAYKRALAQAEREGDYYVKAIEQGRSWAGRNGYTIVSGEIEGVLPGEQVCCSIGAYIMSKLPCEDLLSILSDDNLQFPTSRGVVDLLDEEILEGDSASWIAIMHENDYEGWGRNYEKSSSD